MCFLNESSCSSSNTNRVCLLCQHGLKWHHHPETHRQDGGYRYWIVLCVSRWTSSLHTTDYGQKRWHHSKGIPTHTHLFSVSGWTGPASLKAAVGQTNQLFKQQRERKTVFPASKGKRNSSRRCGSLLTAFISQLKPAGKSASQQAKLPAFRQKIPNREDCWHTMMSKYY